MLVILPMVASVKACYELPVVVLTVDLLIEAPGPGAGNTAGLLFT